MAESVKNDWLTKESHSKWANFHADLTSLYKDATLECDIDLSTVNERYHGILLEAQKYRELIAWGALHMDAFAPYLNDPEGFCRLSNSMLVCLKYNVTVKKNEQTVEFMRLFLREKSTRKVWGAIKKHIKNLHTIIGATKNIRDIENIARKYLEENVVPYQIQKATGDFERYIRNDLDALSRAISDDKIYTYIHRVCEYIGVKTKTRAGVEHWTDCRTNRDMLINMWTWPELDNYIKFLFISVLCNKPRPIIKCEKLFLGFMNTHKCFNYDPKLPNRNLWRYVTVYTSSKPKQSKIEDKLKKMYGDDDNDIPMTRTVSGEGQESQPTYNSRKRKMGRTGKEVTKRLFSADINAVFMDL